MSLKQYNNVDRERCKDQIFAFFSGMKTESLKFRLVMMIKKLDTEFGENWEKMAAALGIEDEHGVADFGYARQSYMETIEYGTHRLRLYVLFGLIWASEDIAAEIAKSVTDPPMFLEFWVPKCVAQAYLNRFRGVHLRNAHEWNEGGDLLSAMFPSASSEIYMEYKFPMEALVVDLSAQYVTCCMTRPEWKKGRRLQLSGIEDKKFAIDYIPHEQKRLTL
jgi:hypothetical protein